MYISRYDDIRYFIYRDRVFNLSTLQTNVDAYANSVEPDDPSRSTQFHILILVFD